MTPAALRRRQTYIVQHRRVLSLDQIVLRPASMLREPAPIVPGFPHAAVLVVPAHCSRPTERAIWLVARQFRKQGRPTRFLDSQAIPRRPDA